MFGDKGELGAAPLVMVVLERVLALLQLALLALAQVPELAAHCNRI